MAAAAVPATKPSCTAVLSQPVSAGESCQRSASCGAKAAAWRPRRQSEASMARQERQAEGDNAQRRKTAKEARDRGRRPSEVGATLGASKQRKEARRQAS